MGSVTGTPIPALVPSDSWVEYADGAKLPWARSGIVAMAPGGNTPDEAWEMEAQAGGVPVPNPTLYHSGPVPTLAIVMEDAVGVAMGTHNRDE